jgi:5-(carboxyamino)imidazole ribonucleotide mutase
MKKVEVGIIMGSSSDAGIMKAAAIVLDSFGVGYEFMVVSAHRSPDLMCQYGNSVDEKGIKVIIAGAGGAAHLPGMMAALTTVPVIGVPIKSTNSLDGWDSLLSIAQMPNDVPVATMAVNGAHNAGVLAVEILAIGNLGLKEQLQQLKKKNQIKVLEQNKALNEVAKAANNE